MASIVSGCVQTGPDKYQHKCDKCGNVESIKRTIPNLGSSTSKIYNYQCNKCKNKTKVFIKG